MTSNLPQSRDPEQNPSEKEAGSSLQMTLDEMYRNIDTTVRQKDDQHQDSFAKMVCAELNNNPELRTLYRETFLEGRQERLNTKTKKQIETLKVLFFKRLEADKLEYVRERIFGKRLKSFQKFVEEMIPIRNDSNPEIKEEFKSPRLLAEEGHNHLIERGDGFYDSPVQGGRYIYASFREICHPMAAGDIVTAKDEDRVEIDRELGIKDRNDIRTRKYKDFTPEIKQRYSARFLDDRDFQGRAEIVMMDIADVQVVIGNMEKHGIRKVPCMMKCYLDNTFDYQGGKKLLAVYLASVFDSVEEAQSFFLENVGRELAESWYKPLGIEEEFSRMKPTPMKNETTNHALQRLRTEHQRMVDIFNETGIMPPLELEIRIPDRAKIL
jgi:hypothetical protein